LRRHPAIDPSRTLEKIAPARSGEDVAMSRRSFHGALLDVAGAAQFLGCSQKTIRSKVSRHVIPFKRLGSRIVFRRTELEQFVEDLPGVSLEESRENLTAQTSEWVTR
jgi:excisionase family DNA binding protein